MTDDNYDSRMDALRGKPDPNRGKPGESIWLEEVDNQTVIEVGDGELRQIMHAMDWGVRSPQTIRLLRDLVVVRPDAESEFFGPDGLIEVPGQVRDDQFQRNDYIRSYNQFHTGTVLAVGPGRYDEDGDRMGLDVKPGDRVKYNRPSASGIIWTDGTTVCLIHCDGGDKGDAVTWAEEEETGT